jgi:hypothetical protein
MRPGTSWRGWADATALRRFDVDTAEGVVRVSTVFTRRYSGEAVHGASKSRASARGGRPAGPIEELLAEHLAKNVTDDGVHLHDLRHTGNTFAATSGASRAG